MTTTNITTASSQYASRPADERFPSVQALIAAAQYDKDHSAERTYNLKDLRAVPEQSSVALQSPRGVAQFTHYSFGQLCRTIGAPAGYLRDLPPTIAADAMNWGLQSSPVGQAANLLVRSNGGAPIVRAATSDTYGRIWDADLYGELNRRLLLQDDRWTTPPTWTGEPAGAYRGDRDSFLIVVNGGSIVQDPSLASQRVTSPAPGITTAPGDGMFRGILVRNSEVGHCSITIEGILFRYICGNHILWGAMVDRTFRRRHVGTKISRDTMREIMDLSYKYAHRTASSDEAIIRGLLDHELAHTKEAVIDELMKMGATKAIATEAYDSCERLEPASPRSFWGVAQGLTRVSQADGWQDDRLKIDQLGALVLKRGMKVAA